MIKESLRNIFLHDWYKKLISLILAVALWFLVNVKVQHENNLEITFKSVPIRFINTPPDTASINKNRQITMVTYSGPKEELQELNIDKPQCIVNLQNASLGNGSYPIELDKAYLPPFSLQHVEYKIAHDTVRLTLAKLKKKEMKVEADHLRKYIEPAEGYEIVSITAAPDRVIVEAAEQVLIGMQSIPTENIIRKNVSESFEQYVKLDYDEQLQNIPESSKRIKIFVDIEKRKGTKTFTKIPVQVKNLYPTMEIIDQKALLLESVTLSGNTLDLDKVIDKDIQATVDLGDVKVSAVASFPVEIAVNKPGIKVSAMSSDSILVNVRKKNSE